MPPEKVALFLIDTLRYDCVGYNPDKKFLEAENVLDFLNTPTLDEIANESVCFTNCYSSSSATVQTITSMFTGTKQANHGIINNGLKMKRKLDEKITTMAEILKKLGYITVCGAETSRWFKAHNMLRGFDYDLSNPPDVNLSSTKSDNNLFDFLSEHKKEKIFLFALFEDIHAPYMWCFNPPFDGYNDDYFDVMVPLLKSYGIEKPNDPTEYWYEINKKNSSRKLWLPIYVKGVTKFDNGRFKTFMNNLNDTGFSTDKSLLVITADHGDGKYRNDAPTVFNHNGDPFDESIKVPLIVRYPESQHEIKDDLVSNIDVFKIITDFCSDYKTENFVSQKLYSINPFIEKREYALHEIIPELFTIDPIAYYILARTIITNNKKYILRGKPENFLDPRIFELDNRNFVVSLYLDLFIRHPTEREIEYFVERLNSKRFYKKQLYDHFLTTEEYKKKEHCIVIDRKNDPFECKLLNATKDALLMKEYMNHFDKLIDLERPDIQLNSKSSEEYDSKELEAIEKELHKLGYI